VRIAYENTALPGIIQLYVVRAAAPTAFLGARGGRWGLGAQWGEDGAREGEPVRLLRLGMRRWGATLGADSVAAAMRSGQIGLQSV
jgi:hypothetical protein